MPATRRPDGVAGRQPDPGEAYLPGSNDKFDAVGGQGQVGNTTLSGLRATPGFAQYPTASPNAFARRGEDAQKPHEARRQTTAGQRAASRAKSALTRASTSPTEARARTRK